MKKKVLVIINPCAGRTKSKPATFDIADVLSSLDFEFDIKVTQKRGDATEFARTLSDGYDAVLCCGGDGTLNETVNGIMKLKKKPQVGYIPTGSTNDFAATIGIPSDIRSAVQLMASDQRNCFDIGNFNERNFCYIATFGVGSEFSYSTPQKLKNALGYPAYMLNTFVLNGVHLLKSIKPVHMTIEHDGGVIDGDYFFGAISNSTSVGGLFTYSKDDVKLNDGIFELLLVKNIKSVPNAVKMLRKMQKHDYDCDQITFMHTRKLKIYSPQKAAWSLDGEYGGTPEEIDFSISHPGIEIFSPPNELFSAGKDEAALKQN